MNLKGAPFAREIEYILRQVWFHTARQEQSCSTALWSIQL